jgi:hypothetical protein
MANYTLKRCERTGLSNSNVLMLVGEWIIRASGDREAGSLARQILQNFRPDEDYAKILDNTGMVVWESPLHTKNSPKR